MNCWIKLLNKRCIARQKIADRIAKQLARMICKTTITDSHVLRIIWQIKFAFNSILIRTWRCESVYFQPWQYTRNQYTHYISGKYYQYTHDITGTYSISTQMTIHMWYQYTWYLRNINTHNTFTYNFSVRMISVRMISVCK